MIFDEPEFKSQLIMHSIGINATNFESSDQPPPTRTITVCDLKMRQKQSLGSLPPIQYFPLLSFQVSATASTLISTGKLLMTSPRAISNLFFGFAIYFDLGFLLSGVDALWREPNDCLGALDQVLRVLVDNAGLTDRGVSANVEDIRLLTGGADPLTVGVEETEEILAVLCREAKVELKRDLPGWVVEGAGVGFGFGGPEAEVEREPGLEAARLGRRGCCVCFEDPAEEADVALRLVTVAGAKRPLFPPTDKFAYLLRLLSVVTALLIEALLLLPEPL